MLNVTDPVDEVDGERSSVKTKHPLFSDPAVRQALNLLIDRDLDAEIHLRPHRRRHGNFVNNPERFLSKTPNSNSTSRRPTRSSTPPAGSAGRTAFAPRTASR